MVPFVDLSPLHLELRQEILEGMTKVYDRGWFIQGDELKAFESEYAKFNGVPFCAGVGNGLDAITLSLEALGIGKGDRVIIPAHTFVATALAVVKCGAEIVLADVESTSGNLSAESMANAAVSGVRAVIPVHLYGQICRMDEIMPIARKQGWFVVEDNAQAQGAELKGRLSGAWGDLSATSFYPGKNIGALGDAGAILTANEELDRQVRRLRNYGSERKYQHEVQGCNSRLDELQASILRCKLRVLARTNQARAKAAKRYDSLLSDIGEIFVPKRISSAGHVYHLYVIRTQEREALQSHLAKLGIESAVHYPYPVHLQKAFSDLNVLNGQFPNSEAWAREVLSLPLYYGITEEQQHRVASAVRSFYGRRKTEVEL